MNIVDNLFRKQKPVLSKLENFGFKKQGRVYVLSRFFMNGDFRTDITVTPGGSVTARVTDTATDEEYLPLNVESYTGEFVGKSGRNSPSSSKTSAPAVSRKKPSYQIRPTE